MSPYAQSLAHARLEALHALIEALRAADTPAEKRRCATALFNAPDPNDIDDCLNEGGTGSSPASGEHGQLHASTDAVCREAVVLRRGREHRAAGL